jgi:cytochrome b561
MTDGETPAARRSGYSLAARGFHWLTAILTLAAFLLSVGGPESRVFGEENQASLSLHESLGVSVFALTLIRLAYRALDAQPEPEPMAIWMRWSARLTHYLLYALLLFVPLSAIVGSWLDGYPLTFYLLGDIASPAAASAVPGHSLLDLHKLGGDAIMWLAGLHAAAALYHHAIVKDGTLRAMTLGQR